MDRWRIPADRFLRQRGHSPRSETSRPLPYTTHRRKSESAFRVRQSASKRRFTDALSLVRVRPWQTEANLLRRVPASSDPRSCCKGYDNPAANSDDRHTDGRSSDAARARGSSWKPLSNLFEGATDKDASAPKKKPRWLFTALFITRSGRSMLTRRSIGTGGAPLTIRRDRV